MEDLKPVHEWFLHRGLPLVLTRRVRSRSLIERSAPLVSGIGALIALTMVLAELTGGAPDVGHAIRLGVLTLLLIGAPFALYLLHRAGTTRSEAGRRSAALLVMALFVFGLPFASNGFSGVAAAEIVGFAFAALVAIWLTFIGFGSIALWAFRFAWVQFGALGALMSRALPLLMLTVLVYFTQELWQLSARITRQRLWQTIAFLTIVAILFMISTIRDEVRKLRDDRSAPTDSAMLLVDTPLAAGIDRQPVRTRLSLAEQVNVVAVMVVAQAIQVVFFTTGLFAFFIALGIIAVPDDVTVLWSSEQSCPVGQPPCAGTWFGIHVPIPQTAVQTSLFVAVLSGLYFTVSTSVDPLYRQRFFEPLIADLAVSLAGRDAYLAIEGDGRKLRLVAVDGTPERSGDVFGKRYGEVLLVRLGDSGPEATVYNTFPLNDCPQELWSELDAAAIARENDAQLVLLNGPRYWLMSGIEKVSQNAPMTKTFGGIEMLRQATVALSSTNPAPYSVNRVSRHTAFTFDAGRPVFELIDPDGRRWVMQTWSQTVDSALSLDDLPGLASRLNLPAGWTYESRTLTSPLRVDTTTEAAHVTQDDLANSYSLQT